MKTVKGQTAMDLEFVINRSIITSSPMVEGWYNVKVSEYWSR